MKYFLLKNGTISEIDIYKLTQEDVDDIAQLNSTLLKTLDSHDYPSYIHDKVIQYWKNREAKKIAEEIEKKKQEHQNKEKQNVS